MRLSQFVLLGRNFLLLLSHSLLYKLLLLKLCRHTRTPQHSLLLRWVLKRTFGPLSLLRLSNFLFTLFLLLLFLNLNFFILDHNIFNVFCEQLSDISKVALVMVKLKILDAEDEDGFDNAGPLSLAVVSQEFADFTGS